MGGERSERSANPDSGGSGAAGDTTPLAAARLAFDDETPTRDPLAAANDSLTRSDCWRRYVYAAREVVRGLSAAMSRVRVGVEGTARDFYASAGGAAAAT